MPTIPTGKYDHTTEKGRQTAVVVGEKKVKEEEKLFSSDKGETTDLVGRAKIDMIINQIVRDQILIKKNTPLAWSAFGVENAFDQVMLKQFEHLRNAAKMAQYLDVKAMAKEIFAERKPEIMRQIDDGAKALAKADQSMAKTAEFKAVVQQVAQKVEAANPKVDEVSTSSISRKP